MILVHIQRRVIPGINLLPALTVPVVPDDVDEEETEEESSETRDENQHMLFFASITLNKI